MSEVTDLAFECFSIINELNESIGTITLTFNFNPPDQRCTRKPLKILSPNPKTYIHQIQQNNYVTLNPDSVNTTTLQRQFSQNDSQITKSNRPSRISKVKQINNMNQMNKASQMHSNFKYFNQINEPKGDVDLCSLDHGK